MGSTEPSMAARIARSRAPLKRRNGAVDEEKLRVIRAVALHRAREATDGLVHQSADTGRDRTLKGAQEVGHPEEGGKGGHQGVKIHGGLLCRLSGRGFL